MGVLFLYPAPTRQLARLSALSRSFRSHASFSRGPWGTLTTEKEGV